MPNVPAECWMHLLVFALFTPTFRCGTLEVIVGLRFAHPNLLATRRAQRSLGSDLSRDLPEQPHGSASATEVAPTDFSQDIARQVRPTTAGSSART
jgi:hypothetical protein